MDCLSFNLSAICKVSEVEPHRGTGCEWSPRSRSGSRLKVLWGPHTVTPEGQKGLDVNMKPRQETQLVKRPEPTYCQVMCAGVRGSDWIL